MIKKGLIKEPMDTSFMEGKDVTITAPDDMLAGEIKYNNKVIFEGEGGVFFVTKFGDVWASGKKGTANTIANALNKQIKTNDGKAYLVLTKGTDAKLVSSASGVNSTLAILNTMLDNKLISPSLFRSAVSSAVRKAKGEINLRQSAKDLKADIKKYFTDPNTSTFEKRGFVVKDIVATIAKNLPKESQAAIAEFLGGDIQKNVGVGNTPAGVRGPGSQSLVDLVAKMAAEKLTKGLNVGDVYAAIEVDGEVEVREDSHPSYPFHIALKGGGKPILHLFKNRQPGGDVLVQSSGKAYAVRNVSVVTGKVKSGETQTETTQDKESVAVREQKQASRKDMLFKLGNQYGLKQNNFFPATLFNPQALRRKAEELGYTLEALYSQEGYDRGRLTGYAFYTRPRSQGGSMVKFPSQRKNQYGRQRWQKTFNKFDNPIDIIKLARQAGFENSEIEYFLRNEYKKKDGKKLKVKEIKDLLKIDLDLFDSIPPVFGNVPGGMNVGRKLFEATKRKFDALIKKNNKLPKKKQRSIADIINESIEFMKTLKPYQESTEGVVSKKEQSTLQQQLEVEMQEALGGRAVKDVSKTISNLKKLIRQKKRGAREIRDIKRQLQRAIREIMPKGDYTKGEVRSLLRTIQEAEPKWLKGNLRNLIGKIEEMAATKNVSTLNKLIDKILSKEFEVNIGGVKRGVKIDMQTRKIVEKIKEKLYKGAEIKDDIIAEQTNIITEINKLNEKTTLTPEEETQMLVLNIALGINNSKLMEDNNPRKADQLAEVYENLKSLVTTGRNNFKDAAARRSKKYAENTSKFYQALTGQKESRDFSDPEVLEEVRKEIKRRADEKASDYGRNRIKKYFQNIGNNISSFLKEGTLGLSQLSETLDRLPGEVFGDGFIKDFVYRKVNESTRMYKESIMALDQLITEKSREYLGPDYLKKIKQYRKQLDFTQIEDGNLFKNPQEVQEAQKKFDNDPTSKNKENLNKTIRENIPFSGLTPLQLQYLYFQYKQPDTHAGFETSLGDNYAEIMDGLSKYFEENYSDLLEMGRWQVEEMLPTLYEKYNKVYRRLYNTDLPQRDSYSGRTFRQLSVGDKVEMEKYDPLSLLSDQGTSQMSMNVIGNSTKLTRKNNKAIMPVDAFTAIDTYIKDMEHFAAYGENMNDISKVFFNKDIANTIVNIHGKGVYDTVRNALMATAKRGANQSDAMVQRVNRANNVFIVQKLGAGLTVYLKQLTSIATYGNYIGYRNWIKTASTMGVSEFKKAWQEISEESVYIKYRYWEQISKTIESYGEKQMETYTPGNKGDKITRLLMSPIKAGDKQAIFLGGIPNYVYLKNKYQKEGMSPEAAKKKAMIKFEEQTKEVQQSSDKQDKDALQNAGGYIQLFNMFMSAPKAYFRQIFGGYRELGRNIVDGSGKGTWQQNLRTIMVYQFAMPMIFQWAGSGFPVTDWDDEDKEDMLRASILSVFNSIFVVGQILEQTADVAQGKPWWKDTKQFPIFDLFTDFYDKLVKAQNLKDPAKQAEAEKQAYFALLPLTAVLGVPGNIASLPLKTLDRMRMNMQKIINSGGDPKEVFLRMFNYSDYVIEGKPEKKPKPKKLNKTEMRKYFPDAMDQIDEFNNSPEMQEYNEMMKEFKQQEKQMRQQALDEAFNN